jgi:predicted ATPase
LNRIARLLALAHGGQVVVSAAAYELASDGGIEGLSFVDLGVHRLRDLEHPEHAWQLVGEGLERRFPPLRSLDTPRGWLPVYLTPFIGRQAELDLLLAVVGEARLVTLVGSGGAGKTRLAAKTGAGLVDRFPDGVWMFQLAGLANPDGLEAAMSSALGLSEMSGLSTADVLFETLAGWRALLIIDNCEHLTDAVAPLVEGLLSMGPRLVVLATSREPLGVPGERVVALGPMAEGDAVRLFVDHAADRRRSLSVSGVDAEVVGRICQQLDCMPLAIELAAARTLAMTPAEIEARLNQRFQLLSSRSGDRTGRHSSLERVVDWSYDLLDADHRAFFVRLAVFAGSFDERAAHQVCWPADDLAALNMLEDLVAKSLLTATWLGDRTSYRLLETMRQYGARHLTREEWESLQERHAEYFAALADKAWDGCRGRHSYDWMDLIQDELDNFRAAIELAFAHEQTDWAVRIAAGLFMYNHTRRLPEIYRWAEEAMSLPDALDHPRARAVQLHIAHGYLMRGELDAAIHQADAVLDPTLRDDGLEPLALTTKGSAMVMAGQAGGESVHAAALSRALELGPAYDYDRGEIYWNIWAQALWAGRRDSETAAELLALAKQTGNARALGAGLIATGLCDPDPTRGEASLVEALHVTGGRSGDTFRHGAATAWLGVVRSSFDPLAMLRVIPDMLEHVRFTGQRLLVVAAIRECLPALAYLRRCDDIAVIDGAALPVSIRPAAAAAAVGDARAALGDDRYDELVNVGRAMSYPDFEHFLTTLATETT